MMCAGRDPMRTPKQAGRSSWYAYYAGFSSDFAQDALTYLRQLSGDGLVIDPWNGSGTTTTVATSIGFESVAGFDINPALTLIARGRNVPVSFRSSLEPLAKELLVAAERSPGGSPDKPEPLSQWLKPRAADSFRRLRNSIDLVLVDTPTIASGGPVSELAAFYYTAAFSSVRELLTRFRATNPTWLKTPGTAARRLSPSWETISDLFLASVAALSERLTLTHHQNALPSIATASSLSLPIDDGLAACCLTSPPYCTRIDYAVASRAELAFLGLDAQRLSELRSASLGTTVTPREVAPWLSTSSTISSVLPRIEQHPSKAAAGYYSRYFRNYFRSLEVSLGEVDRAVRRQGAIGVVVQDSHFKNVHIDLQQIVIDVLTSCGRRLVDRHDFSAPRSWAGLNPTSRVYEKQASAHESFLVFS
jgi:hypothetical protein